MLKISKPITLFTFLIKKILKFVHSICIYDLQQKLYILYINIINTGIDLLKIV